MSSPLTHGGRGADKAFTLIELLTVIAIIGVLAGITFGIAKGVQERAAVQQARSELSAFAAALENYKRQYGDYPQTGALTSAGHDSTPAIGAIAATSAQAAFFNALGGKYGPKLARFANGKVFTELSKFTLETTNLPVLNNDVVVANAFLDPWGRRYIYVYRDASSPNTWAAPSYVLFSVGPDGRTKASDPTSTGAVDFDHTDNLDNIYANR